MVFLSSGLSGRPCQRCTCAGARQAHARQRQQQRGVRPQGALLTAASHSSFLCAGSSQVWGSRP